jgi:hypothetical protein
MGRIDTDFALDGFADAEAEHWPLLEGQTLFDAKEGSLARMRALRETIEALRAELARASRWDEHLDRLLRQIPPH